jgi:hypothetical protein
MNHCLINSINFFNYQGIKLDIDKIKPNPGLRTLAKLTLNTLWGYFAMDTRKATFEIISDVSRWNDLLHNDRFEISSEYFQDNFLQVTYTEREEFHVGSNKTNVIIASFVTCQGRLKLYDELDRLGDRVLYFDTDSIFYIHRKNQYNPPIGTYLGEFTREIDPRDGNYITIFDSTGAKSYAYMLDTGHTEITVKGLTFNYQADQVINFDSLNKMVCEDQTVVIEVPQLKFCLKKNEWVINTDVINKKFRFTYDKRVIKHDFSTLPYGY